MKTDTIKRERNRASRSTLRRAIRRYRELATEDRANAYNGLQSTLDVAVKKGLIPLNRAARLKSRLAPGA